MNVKVEQTAATSPVDVVKYVLAAAIALAGIVGFYWFADWPGPLRGVLVAVAIVAGFAVFAFTARGRAAIEFLSESRFELRKVVWPTRQEAMQTTWVVFIAVAVISLILAGFDVVIQAAVKWLLGR